MVAAPGVVENNCSSLRLSYMDVGKKARVLGVERVKTRIHSRFPALSSALHSMTLSNSDDRICHPTKPDIETIFNCDRSSQTVYHASVSDSKRGLCMIPCLFRSPATVRYISTFYYFNSARAEVRDYRDQAWQISRPTYVDSELAAHRMFQEASCAA